MADVTGTVRDVANALIGLAGIRAVSLGGSRALGMDDASSDTDLYAWYRGTLVGAAVRQQALADLADDVVVPFDAFGPEDHWHSDRRPFEVVYVDLDVIRAQISRARSVGLDGEVCATAFLHTAYAGVPIADPYAELDRLQTDLASFPEATRTTQLLQLPNVADRLRTACLTAPNDPSLAEQFVSLIAEIVALYEAGSSSAAQGRAQEPDST